eukprot:220737-Chlamydomonas_euryale.AAC.1
MGGVEAGLSDRGGTRRWTAAMGAERVGGVDCREGGGAYYMGGIDCACAPALRRNQPATDTRATHAHTSAHTSHLLLHGLVDGHAVLVVHLVKLVDEADALVGEHERSALEHPLARERVAVHTCCQADSRCALAGTEGTGGVGGRGVKCGGRGVRCGRRPCLLDVHGELPVAGDVEGAGV